MTGVWFLAGAEGFLFVIMSRQDGTFSQARVLWIPGLFLQVIKWPVLH